MLPKLKVEAVRRGAGYSEELSPVVTLLPLLTALLLLLMEGRLDDTNRRSAKSLSLMARRPSEGRPATLWVLRPLRFDMGDKLLDWLP